MDTKSSLILGGSIVAASVFLGLMLRPEPPGRFQMSGIPGHAYVIDTETGQVWETFATTGEGTNDADFKMPKVK